VELMGKVTKGEVSISEIRSVISGPNVRIWEVDLDTKHAEVAVCGTEVYLHAGDRTIFTEEGLEGISTVISFPAVPDYWTVIAEACRYTVRIVAYDPTSWATVSGAGEISDGGNR
jgi:hypothetical protein